MVSAALMLGTSSCRDPSRTVTSMARPRLTCSGVATPGFPSTRTKAWFIAGVARSACTTAKPMRWVNETLPPRPRARWLLITIRLSASSLAGMDRTLVAVGTPRLATMFSAVRAAAPRNRTTASGAAAGAAGCWAGLPSGAGWAGRAGAAAGAVAGAGAGAAVPGAAACGAAACGAAPCGAACAGAGVTGAAGAGRAACGAAAAGGAGLPGGGR